LFVVFCVAIYLARYPLMRWVAESWIVEDPLAQARARFAADHRRSSVMVVTSNYHTRRARYIFRRVFPKDIAVFVASARDGDFDPQQWWGRRESIKELTRALAGMLVAVWELRSLSDSAEKSQSIVWLRGLIPQLAV
jgi:hypothetical protein